MTNAALNHVLFNTSKKLNDGLDRFLNDQKVGVFYPSLPTTWFTKEKSNMNKIRENIARLKPIPVYEFAKFIV